MQRALVVGLLMLAVGPDRAAAEATPEGARGLLHVLQRYVGTPAAGDSGLLRVEPDGDGYQVRLDFPSLLRPFQPFVKVDAAEVSIRATPRPDGTWLVDDLHMPESLTVRVEDQTISYHWQDFAAEGVFDPTLPGFATFDDTIGGVTAKIDTPLVQSFTRTGEQVIRGATTAVGPGIVDTTVDQTVVEMSVAQTFTPPPAAGSDTSPPQIATSYSIESGEGHGGATGLKAQKLLDLWAYGVRRFAPDAAPLDQQELKGLLTDLLPIFTRVDQSVVVEALEFGTPAGQFGVGDFKMDMAFSGLTSDGLARFSLNLADPSYPAALVPAWAADFVPKDLGVTFELSGFDLDAAARSMIEDADFSRQPFLTDEQLAAAGRLTLPEEGAKLKLEPSHLVGALLDIEAEGELALHEPEPTGSFEIVVKGLDKAVAALGVDTTDPQKAQLLGFLTLAQAQGRRGDDGSAHYTVVFTDDGAITVNGQTIRPPHTRDL